MKHPTPSLVSPASRTQVRYDDIAARAKLIWEQLGQPVGRDVEIWLAAERALGGRIGSATDDARFANPQALLNRDGLPNDEVDDRLNEVTDPGDRRSATSI